MNSQINYIVLINKAMKKGIVLLKPFIFLFSILNVLSSFATDYTVSFSGSGLSSTVDSVVVQNLKLGIKITVPQGSVLNLVDVTAIDQLIAGNKSMIIFPNPMLENATMSFYAKQSGKTSINVIGLDGKSITSFSSVLNEGNNSFQISLPIGFYVIQVIGNSFFYSSKVISHAAKECKAIIINNSSEQQTKVPKKIKNTIYSIPYTSGDYLIYRGFSGNFSNYKSDITADNKNINFDFSECKDANGRNYPTVMIGTQIWMAENLAYLPTVNNLIDGSEDEGYETIPFYYVNGYNGTDIVTAKSTSYYKTYGVLYNYNAALIAAPKGWHLPTNDEWMVLRNFLGGVFCDGKTLKSTTGWIWPNMATNSNCFNALPGGNRGGGGSVNEIGYRATWWCSTESIGTPWICNWNMFNNSTNLGQGRDEKSMGFSIRCIKD